MSKNYVPCAGPDCIFCKAGWKAQPAPASVRMTDTKTGKELVLTGKVAERVLELTRRKKLASGQKHSTIDE